MRTISILLLVLAAITSAPAQPKAEPSFEVASIKLSPPPLQGRALVGMRGGPGSSDPLHATFSRYRLSTLISIAYELYGYQLDGRDPRLEQEFDINVGIPAGATRNQLPIMIRTLLNERFHLRVHREKKMIDVYDLVQAKGGHRLKPPSAPGEIRPGQTVQTCNSAGCRMQQVGQSLDPVINQLSVGLNAPIKDATGLAGQKFDYVLSWGASSTVPNRPIDAPPPLATAIDDQLGLRVERSKGEVDVLIVDSVDTQPTEN
jgi:uncharacterized protein (TIGR03435 family)